MSQDIGRRVGLESLSAADLPIRCVRSHRTVDDIDREDQALVFCGARWLLILVLVLSATSGVW